MVALERLSVAAAVAVAVACSWMRKISSNLEADEAEGMVAPVMLAVAAVDAAWLKPPKDRLGPTMREEVKEVG